MNNHKESIVLVGGGGGVYRVARFLKNIREKLTTIQEPFDHGSHSGILRDERGVLPPGDIRQAILALADDNVEPVLRSLLAFRFSKKGTSSLNNATVGNILLTALEEITGSFPVAINTLCRWYGVKGKVLPVSLDHAELCVELSDGSVICGEGKIDTRSIDDDRSIRRAYLTPEAYLYNEARDSILSAEKIVFCPGDLFTSVVPNLLVNGFAEAVQESRAKIVFIVNLVTKKAETDKYRASDFAKTALSCLGMEKMDYIVCNDPTSISSELRDKYSVEKSYPVEIDVDNLKELCNGLVVEKLSEESGGIIRHSSRIASIVASF